MYIHEPLSLVVTEEIGLEGLDGITLDGLWFRISERIKIPQPFAPNFKEQIWNYVKSQDIFEYFEIPENRGSLQSYSRDDFFYNEDHDEIESKLESSYYLYKFCPIEENTTIFGSCEHFKTRMKVSIVELMDSSVQQVEEKYQQKLVIVANQKVRSSILIPNCLNTDVELVNITYCLLERIGRSRYFGEMNSGKFSLGEFVKDSGLLHYQRNILLKYKLVVKQQFQQRVKNVVLTGTILHLPRFYRIYRHKNGILAESIINYLKTKPEYMADYDDVKNHVGIGVKSLAKMFKHSDFQNIVECDLKVPYRKFYPDAKPEEYSYKNKTTEKTLHAIKLLKPEINAYDIWYRGENNEEEKEETGFLDNTRDRFNVPMLKQAYDLIKETKHQGISQTELGKTLGLSKLCARSIIRNLERNKIVVSFTQDEGRQRVSRYILQKFNRQNQQEFCNEINKLLKNAPKEAKTRESTSFEPIAGSSKEFTVPIPIELSSDDDDDDEPQSRELNFADHSSVIDNIEQVKVTMKQHRRVPGAKKDHGIQWYLLNNKMTKKMLHRMNYVLEQIKIRKMIDFIELMTLVSKMEEDETDYGSHTEKMCRKSLRRLLNRLALDRFINVMEVQLESSTKKLSSVFFCDSTVNADHQDWSSIIEEEKLKNFVPGAKKSTDPTIKLEEISQDTPQKNEVCPKFIKMKMFHELLHYLIYFYPETHEKIPITDAITEWQLIHPNRAFDDIESQITCVYSREIDWKMFIPPLPTHQGYSTGWGFVRDVIHRIPLIMYVKLVQPQGAFPEILKEFLAHPIKCNYLLHFLPQELREFLTLRRKHVFSVDELCKRLCFAGLLQFGFQKSKGKDEVFIYLNRNASLWDTTTSEPGYLEISNDKEYPVLSYHFDSDEVVKDYWTEMFTICTHTRLNNRSTAIGKELLIESLSTKPAMLKTLELRTPETAPEFDNGEIPGDHLGAGGLDKGFHSHLKQNWSRVVVKIKKSRPKRPALVKKFGAVKKIQKKYQAMVKNLQPKRKIVRKTVRAIQTLVKRKVSYDAVDKEALKLMKTLRVSWTPVEDTTLIMCKVALAYAFQTQNQTSHFVNSSLFRDILHWCYKQSNNKTSRACQRRILYITKNNPAIKENIALYLEELRSNKEFNRFYGPGFVQNLKKYYKNDYVKFTTALRIHLIQMIFRIHQIFNKVTHMENLQVDSKVLILPSDFKRFHEYYKISNPQKAQVEYKYKNPDSLDDLEACLLSSLIHGTMCSIKDRANYTMQLFDIYKNYKDRSLSQAVANLRQNRILSTIKFSQKRPPHTNMKILPFSFSPYHLSINYNNQLFMPNLQFTLFAECFTNTVVLSNVEYPDSSESEITATDCGMIFMISEFLLAKKIQLNYRMPDKVVSMNPKVSKTEPNLDQLTRFQEIMQFREQVQLKNVKKAVNFNVNDEKYIYEENPFEFIQKIDVNLWHIFCILQKVAGNKKSNFKDLQILEGGECNLDTCVLKGPPGNLVEIFGKIAERSKDFIASLLRDQEKDSWKNEFMKFLNGFLSKQFEENKKTHQKEVGKKLPNPLKLHDILEVILGFTNPDFMENDRWISDYNKSFIDDDILDADVGADKSIEEKKDEGDLVITRLSKQLKGNEYEKKLSLNDMFVVNFSKFFVKILDAEQGSVTFDNQQVLEKLIPFDEKFRDEVLNKVRDDAIWTAKNQSLQNLENKLVELKLNEYQKIKVFEILMFLEESQELGVAAARLLEYFQDKSLLENCLKILIENGYVLRSGFDAVVYIHWRFASNWLVKTYSSTNAVKVEEDATNKRKADDVVEEIEPKRIKIEESASVKIEPESSRSAEKKQKEQEEIDERQRNYIEIRPCPWIRINGTLNRRVMDRWLSTILAYIMTNPGVLLVDIFKRFNVLAPFDIRYLLEILQAIGAIKLMAYHESEVSLFSTNEIVEIGKASDFDAPESCFVEVCEDAVQRLSFLIGLKKYKAEFI